MDKITNHFINPFEQGLEHEKLYNVVSGAPVEDSICESLGMPLRKWQKIDAGIYCSIKS